MGGLEQDDWAKTLARVITTKDVVMLGIDHVWQEILRVVGDDSPYLTFDLDVIDPAYAPDVADREIDELTTREVLQILHRLRRVWI
jgi:guanidinopropionase